MADYHASDTLHLDGTRMYSTTRKLATTESEAYHCEAPLITNHDQIDHTLPNGTGLTCWDSLLESIDIPNYYQYHNHESLSLMSRSDSLLGAIPWEEMNTLQSPPETRPNIDDSRKKFSKDPQRQKSRLSRRAVLVLEEWLSRHQASPYPTEEDKCRLETLSGLRRAQISNWFANARKRRKVSSARGPRPEQGEPEQWTFPHMGPLHPFERWLTLGLEFEAASVTAIHHALTETQTCQEPPRLRDDVDRCTNWQYFGGGPSSISSLGIRSYAANRSADADQQRLRGFRPLERLERRCIAAASRGQQVSRKRPAQDESKPFQCTFCNDTFRRKHEWQRHEKSRHLPLEKWTCTPHGGTAADPTTCAIVCAFCGENDPTPEHLEGHSFATCARRSLHERTFYRKDHLRQHLRLSHGVLKWTESMEEWRTIPEVVRSRCGFCNAQFETWQARVDHIAGHFLDRASMADWVGDWGFEFEVMSILEHATAPQWRQIGFETSHGLPDNFSASSKTIEDRVSQWDNSLVFEYNDTLNFEDFLPSITSGDMMDYCNTTIFEYPEVGGQSLDPYWQL